MTGRRRSALDDRGPAVDLFDDPPWDSRTDRPRTPLAWIRHLAFVLFVAAVCLVGLVAVGGVISIMSLITNFKLGLGPIGPLIDSPSSYGMDIVLSADGSRAFVTEPTADRLVVVDTATGATLADVAVGATPSGLALSPDGSQVWVVDTGLSPSSSSASVTVVSTATDTVVGTVTTNDFGPIDVAFSPYGRWAYVTDNGILGPGSVSVVDTSTLTVVGTLSPSVPASSGTPPWNPTSVAVTPDGSEVWISEVSDNDGLTATTTAGVVDVFDATTSTQMATIPVGGDPYFMVLSHDGRDAYVADKGSCDIKEIDTTTFEVVATVAWPLSPGCPFGLAAGPADNVVYAVTGNDQTFDEEHAGNSFGSVDFAASTVTVSGRVGFDPVTLALSPDGATAYVVDADRPSIDLVDTATGAVTSTLSLPTVPSVATTTTAATVPSI